MSRGGQELVNRPRRIFQAPIEWRAGITTGSSPRRQTFAVVAGSVLIAMAAIACDSFAGPAASVSSEALEATPVAAATEQELVMDGEQDRNLIRASDRGDLAEVTRLLEAGASVHARDERGRTPLIAAAYGNHLDVARALIAAGADVNVKDSSQQSAYLIPTADGDLEMLRLTLQSGADVHSTDSYNGTGLIRAADRGHVEIIRELLRTPINVDHVNRLGWTALLEAIILGDGGPRHTEVVRLLVEAGANVNLADGNGVTPLTHARQRGFGAIIAILNSAGAH
jgi:ankyrin repeat protein